MAVYKVAQDVEADDKLIGPFSARQFIYLVVAVVFGGAAWGLSQIFIGLAIIPLPLVFLFVVLALPLRKDQPMEVYLGALISYFLKQRKRIWIPDGVESLVEITVPKTVEVQRTKSISENEAERRLSYLADIADTGGWAIRHAAKPFSDQSPMVDDVYNAAQQTIDVLDDQGDVARSLDTMISRADEQRREAMVERMQHAVQAQSAAPVIPPIADPYASLPDPNSLSATPVNPPIDASLSAQEPVAFNPYPDSIRQSVIQPLSSQNQSRPQPAPAPAVQNPPANPEQSTRETTLSPDIINLANNTDLSIETIQREADRIDKKKRDDGEVFISLH